MISYEWPSELAWVFDAMRLGACRVLGCSVAYMCTLSVSLSLSLYIYIYISYMYIYTCTNTLHIHLGFVVLPLSAKSTSLFSQESLNSLVLVGVGGGGWCGASAIIGKQGAKLPTGTAPDLEPDDAS